LPWIGPFSVLEGPDDNNNYKVKFGPMMSSAYSCIAMSQIKLYLFPDKSMYPSKCFPRREPIKVEGEEAWVVEKILDDRKKNQYHQFLVH
jgi:hypothetical protein